MKEQLHIGNLLFTLHRSERRNTIGITVDRDGSLILRAPVSCSSEKIEQVAREKIVWIYAKLAEKKLLFRPPRPKKFVNGEGFYYLGESYRLLLLDPPVAKDQIPPLQLRDDWFMLRRDERSQAEYHFVNWYTQKANEWIKVRVRRFASRVDVQPKGLSVRRLGFRWGSCTNTGGLNFHWRIILLPPEIIDYILIHELVHLHEPYHNSKFWCRVERVIPDYVQRRRWLSENGGDL